MSKAAAPGLTNDQWAIVNYGCIHLIVDVGVLGFSEAQHSAVQM